MLLVATAFRAKKEDRRVDAPQPSRQREIHKVMQLQYTLLTYLRVVCVSKAGREKLVHKTKGKKTVIKTGTFQTLGLKTIDLRNWIPVLRV